MTNKIDMTIDNCRACGLQKVYVYNGVDARGDIYQFDVCDKCEDLALNAMTSNERVASLFRWTYGNVI